MELSELQAVALSDGSTAFIQQTIRDGSLVEANRVELEDCSTAFIQHLTLQHKESLGFEDTQEVQLEDGTMAFIHNNPKEGLEAVQLEDGSTAFIHQAGRLGSDTIAMLQNYTSKLKLWSSSTLAERNFQCGHAGCGRYYTTAHHLKVHERTHIGDRPYRCDLPSCGKTFATGYGLKSHSRTHTGEKPYKCSEDMCYKAFKTSGDLQKHLRTHTGEKPFRCPFEGCGRSFTTSNIRKVHTRTHTGERPYLCDEPSCGRAFASATNYKNHMRIHTGEKPYLCTMPGCGKSFTEYSSLYKHHVVHTHCKPYTCSRCGKNYRQTSTLTLHKRSAHGDFDSAEDDGEVFQGSPQTRELNESEVTIEMDDATSSQPRVIDAAVTMVTQDSVTIALPRSQSNMLRGEQQVAMVTEGHELQPVGYHSNICQSHDGALAPAGGAASCRKQFSDRCAVRRPADARGGDHHGYSGDSAQRTDFRLEMNRIFIKIWDLLMTYLS